MADAAWFDPKYKVPSSGSSYMRFQDGDNLVRFLMPPALGNELWMSGKPTRRHLGEVFTPKEVASADTNKFTGKPKDITHFWACVVWDYRAKKIAILNITQGTIQEDLLKLASNVKWGTLDKYDVNIMRTKEGQMTKYSVQPEPPSPIDPLIKSAVKKIKVDMEKYFTGGNPLEDADGTEAAPSEQDIDDILGE